jgi:ABC-type uncharacterized transport system permease subunit
MMPLWIYQSAFLLQLFSLALYLAYAAKPQKSFAVAATWLLCFAALLQFFFTALLALRDQAVPLGNPFESLNFWALIFTAVTLVLELRYQVGLLGVFLVPFSALLILMGFRFETALPVKVAPLGGIFLLAHVGMPMAAYALFTAAAGLGVAWLVGERQLKSGRPGSLSYQLPALEVLERAAWRSCTGGFWLLSLGLLWGFLGNREQFLAHFRADSTVMMSLLTFMFYGGLLLFKARPLRGRRFALLLLLGYGALFFAYYLVNIYWGGHALAAGGVS